MTDTTVTQGLGSANLPQLVSAADLLLDGFPSADLVPVVLAQVPGQVRPVRAVSSTPAYGLSQSARFARAGRHGWAQGEGPQGSLRLSPGTVELIARDEARAERARATHRTPRGLSMAWEVPDVPVPFARQWVDPATGELLDQEQELERSNRSRITEWSAKSRANMVRRMASTDWRPMFSTGIAPMVTLTEPGPWTAFAPTRADFGRHLEAFKEAYRRDFLTGVMVGPLNRVKDSAGRWRVERRRRISEGVVMGAWKVEYQGRGAPHAHLLLPVPRGFTVAQYREWVAATWHGIVWNDRGSDFLRLLGLLGHDSTAAGLIYAEHARRHLAAGTSVDVAEGVKCRDPRRIAVYFLGHSLKHKDGKEYQHRLPASYAGRAGRWWGIWGLEDAGQTVYLDADAWWALREALGDYTASQGRAAFQGGRMMGGWLALNDAPEFLLSLLADSDVLGNLTAWGP